MVALVRLVRRRIRDEPRAQDGGAVIRGEGVNEAANGGPEPIDGALGGLERDEFTFVRTRRE